MLRARIAKKLGEFALDVALEARGGSTIALLGESGSGKTTLLRLLAGVLDPDAGRIELDGVVWHDGAHRSLAAWQRPVGYVAQDYALFPHLTVEDNVAFGLRAQRRPAAEVRERVAMALDQLGVRALAHRHPAQLSGGQQQRVALTRALVLEPKLLLLDEPLAALDLQTRRTVRGELHRLLETLSCVTIYVTHAPAEAFAFGDQVAVLEHGRIAQIGTPEAVRAAPASEDVAELLGLGVTDRGS